MIDLNNYKTVRDFRDYDFDSCDVPEKYWGDYTHVNFAKRYFAPILKREMRKIAKNIGCEIEISNGYFEWWCQFKKNGCTIEVIIGDVRFLNGWYDCVLYREKGGGNYYCSYEDIENNIERLFTFITPRG